ncbi:MAG: hypothetical protein CL670_04585 [Balneola sp.]|jgi:hypothetical protein|nr:hypothetical protein [Balneola sp.]MBE78407.1 hypothetical protein [Balneola sp.]HBX66195.1 hypothetical protein [Balneolaceae bacterium]|tara:strand:+ start:1000 stop:1533 length:534 start_codon:yes stop_codon:yes gene_type:complete
MNKLSNDTVKKLNQRVDEFIVEIEPSEDHLFTYDELMPIYKSKLQEYSELVFGKINKDYIDEEFEELTKKLTAATLDATDGSDEILTEILGIECAKIVFKNNEVKSSEEVDQETKAYEAQHKAMSYLFIDGNKPGMRVTEEFKRNIYRDIRKKEQAANNSGCLVLIFALSSLAFYLA